MVDFPLFQPVLKINFMVTMWDTPDSNGGGVGGVLSSVGSAVLSAATQFVAGGHRRMPVADVPTGAVGFDHGHGGGGQLLDVGEDRPGRRDHGVQAEVVVQAQGIDGAVDAAPGQQRRQRGRKAQGVRPLVQV